MPYTNTVSIMGYLTEKPELLTTRGGKKVAEFTIAQNFRFNGKDFPPEFFDVQLWENWAVNLCKTVEKGSLVLVEGRLKQERWKNQGGQTRSRIKVLARRAFHLTTPPREGQRDPGEEYDYQEDGPPLDDSQIPTDREVPF